MVNYMIQNKKAVSPLIATVLIIGFTVALAAVVITWGSRFVQQTQEEVDITSQIGLACSKLDFRVDKIECENGFCARGLCNTVADCPAPSAFCVNGLCIMDFGALAVCTTDSNCLVSGTSCFANISKITMTSNSNQDITGFTFIVTNPIDVNVDTGNENVILNGFYIKQYSWAPPRPSRPIKFEAIAHVTVGGRTEVCQAGIEKVESTTSLCGYTP